MRLKMMIITLAFVTALVPSSVFAGQSGYIRHGQAIIVYKDGKKVGDWPTDEKTDAKNTKAADRSTGKLENREPASSPITNDTLYFIDDAPSGGKNVRCYAISNAIGFAKSEPVSCVRTDN